jgi:hypothetical protein
MLNLLIKYNIISKTSTRIFYQHPGCVAPWLYSQGCARHIPGYTKLEELLLYIIEHHIINYNIIGEKIILPYINKQNNNINIEFIKKMINFNPFIFKYIDVILQSNTEIQTEFIKSYINKKKNH